MLEKIRVQDFLNLTTLVDVLLVGLFLYWLISVIRGTRAVQLIKGLVVLFMAAAVSSWLRLKYVHWILSQAITVLLVALPVVFQPELRRALEKLGGGDIFSSTFSSLNETDLSRVIEEIVRAVYVLAGSRTGALVVLERTTGLEEYVDRGVKIEGVVSAELLVNIFTPNSPLHDGAVIIRGGRIAAAACFLPLAEGLQVGKELGTRHRAGIGITEVSDALAVIVSEETGEVSLAVEGVLARALDRANLTDRLQALLKPKPGRRSLTFLWRRKG
ncbi:MAG: diadenylate cyclase CdaA [Desulfotomaculales bacterium]